MKKVIIVRTSGDGTIGVYTNKKKAFDVANKIMQSCEYGNMNISYNQFCKALGNYEYTYEHDHYTYIYFEVHYLNQY